MKKRVRENQGFTLIELVVSLTIFSVISLSVYSSFAAGIKVWRRSQEFSSVYQTARVVLDSMAMELTNTVKLAGSEFQGGARTVSFISVPRDNKGRELSRDSQVAKVTFEVRRDPQGNGYALFRRQALSLERRGDAQLMVGSLDSVDFEYTYQNNVGGLQPWMRTWRRENEIPLGVKITLKLGGTAFTKMVLIPHGYREEQEE